MALGLPTELLISAIVCEAGELVSKTFVAPVIQLFLFAPPRDGFARWISALCFTVHTLVAYN